MDSKTLALGVVIGLAVGLAGGWLLKPAPEPQKQDVPSRPRERAGEKTEVPTGPKALYTGDDIDAARADERAKAKAGQDAAVEKATEALRREKKELASRLEQAEKDLAEAQAAKAPPEPPKPGKDPLVKFGKHADMVEIREAKWDELAETSGKMRLLLEKLMKAHAEGKEPDPADRQEIMALNRVLQGHAIKVLRKLPTHASGNGEYTHPISLANLMANALKGAGKSLTEAQLKRMAELGEDYEAAWEKAQAGYTEQTLKLEKLIDELELKHRFYDGCVGLMAADQRAVIVNEEWQHVVGIDLYSPALMLSMNVRPLLKASREELRAEALAQMSRGWKIEAAALEGQAFLVDNWLTELGDFLNPVSQSAAEVFRSTEALVLGRAQIKFMKELILALNLAGDSLKLVRGDDDVVYPRVVQAK